MALLNIAMPDLTEEETIDLALQWIEPDDVETVVAVEGYELVGQVWSDQRIYSIYSD